MVTHCDQASYLESQTVCLTMYYVVFQQIEWPSLGVVGLLIFWEVIYLCCCLNLIDREHAL